MSEENSCQYATGTHIETKLSEKSGVYEMLNRCDSALYNYSESGIIQYSKRLRYSCDAMIVTVRLILPQLQHTSITRSP
jgi:hypothetical protein